MNINDIIIFGAGEMAEIAWYYFVNDSKYNPVAFCLDDEFIQENSFCNLPVIPISNISTEHPATSHHVYVAIGYSNLNSTRTVKLEAMERIGYRAVSYVSSKATVWPGFELGSNTFVLEDNTIQPFTRIGKNVTLWSGNHIGHHSTISDNCFITSHAVISGGVMIEENSFIGVNSTIRDHVRIGHHCVLGAGSIITSDTEPYGVYLGSTSKRHRVPSNRLRTI